MKEALEKGTDDLKKNASRLNEKLEATPLSDTTLKTHVPPEDIRRMNEQINSWIGTLDRLELKGKVSSR